MPTRSMLKPFALCVLFLCFLHRAGTGPGAAAQVPLFLANEETRVHAISFDFAASRSFEAGQLKRQIATTEPGFFDKVKKILPFVSPEPHLLDPVELQRDIVRLRRFYNNNGYLFPDIDYPASRLDTTHNTIHLIISIDEGPPLIIQDVGFFAPSGRYAVTLFEGELRDQWIRFRDRTSFRTGDRYTDFDLVRIEDQVLTWLKDNGFAFAELGTDLAVDSTANTVDIGFSVDPGPRGYFAHIEVEGNQSVTDRVVRRELPFKEGERFSNRKLIQGQRELFGLNLFRVALAEVPSATADSLMRADTQPRDSTVDVRFRVREANLRYLTAQTGYALETGVVLEGQWSHRNFSGGARNLTIGGTANTGFKAATRRGVDDEAPILLEGSITLRQPYLFTNKLSATVGPFLRYERDPLLEKSDKRLGINRREIGASTSLLYEFFPFRNISLGYSLSKLTQFAEQRPSDELPTAEIVETPPFSKSALTLSGTFGWTNNFFNPRRGYLIRPAIEDAGGLLAFGVEYFKASTEVVAYIPITRRISVGTRLSTGRLWPRGRSKEALFTPGSPDSLVFEDRFDPILFYAGGSSDVRGWSSQLVGPKINRTEYVLDEEGHPTLDDNGLPQTQNERFEEVGGLARLVGNIELRLPFPGLGDQWRSAFFLDVGQVSTRQLASGAFQDNGRLRLGAFKYGVGTGIRYETPVGFIRLDLAFKINPDDLDLQTPRSAFLHEEGFIDADEKFIRRFKIHLSLGQSF